jgi:hypothetical protein
VNNPDFADGLSSSLKAGIRAVPEACAGAIICLGDMPRVSSALIDRLIDGFAPERGAMIVAPARNKQRGNPVLWAQRFFPELLKLEGDMGARKLTNFYDEGLAEIEVERRQRVRRHRHARSARYRTQDRQLEHEPEKHALGCDPRDHAQKGIMRKQRNFLERLRFAETPCFEPRLHELHGALHLAQASASASSGFSSARRARDRRAAAAAACLPAPPRLTTRERRRHQEFRERNPLVLQQAHAPSGRSADGNCMPHRMRLQRPVSEFTLCSSCGAGAEDTRSPPA